MKKRQAAAILMAGALAVCTMSGAWWAADGDNEQGMEQVNMAAVEEAQVEQAAAEEPADVGTDMQAAVSEAQETSAPETIPEEEQVSQPSAEDASTPAAEETQEDLQEDAADDILPGDVEGQTDAAFEASSEVTTEDLADTPGRARRKTDIVSEDEGIDLEEETEAETEDESEDLSLISDLIEDTGNETTDSIPDDGTFSMPGFFVDPTKYPPANITKNTSYIYFYLREGLQLNHAAACGVLANIQLESNFRPIALGDGGTSYGICQWHLGRFSNLIHYDEMRGFDYNTLQGQLEYLTYELENGYSPVLSYLRGVEDSAQGAYDAAYTFCYHFEIPDHTQERSMQRGNLAMNEYFGREFEISDEDLEIKQDVLEFLNVSWDEDSKALDRTFFANLTRVPLGRFDDTETRAETAERQRRERQTLAGYGSAPQETEAVTEEEEKEETENDEDTEETKETDLIGDTDEETEPAEETGDTQ